MVRNKPERSVLKKSIKYCSLFLSLLSATMAMSQEAEVDYDLDEIKVRANLQAYYQEDTREEKIDSLLTGNYLLFSLAEALSKQGGLVISSYGSRGSLSGVKIRGTGNSHTRFQWNGIPVNSLTTGTMDASLIPAGFMQDISVTRGASGVMAGNASFGGAVRLENTANWSERLRISLASEIGSFSYKAFMPSLVLSNDNIQYRLSYQNLSAVNDFVYTDVFKPGSPPEKQINDSLAQWALMQNMFFRLSGNTQIDAGLWLQGKSKDIPPVMGSYQIAPANQKDGGMKSYIRISKLFHSSRLRFQIAYTADSLHYTKIDPDKEGSLLIDSKIKTNSLFTITEYRWFAGRHISIDLGAHSEHPRAVVDAYGTMKKENRLSLITAAKYRAGGWIVNLGLRKEFNPYNPPKPLASLGISWKSANQATMLRANISNKFRIPSFNERYWQPGGKPNLLPESGWGGEIGWKWQKETGKGLETQIEPVIYYQKIKNHIQWVPAPGYWVPKNQDIMISKGLELNGHTALNTGNWRLALVYRYAFTDAVQMTDGEGDDYSGVIYVPGHQAILGLSIKYGKLRAGVDYQYLGERPTTADGNPLYKLDAVNLFNLNVSQKYHYQGLNMEMYFRLNNIFNHQYQIIRSYATPGINWAIGLKVDFVKLKTQEKNED